MTRGENKFNPDDYLLLLIDAPPYRGLMQRHQQIVTRLTNRIRIVYHEESPSILSCLLKKQYSSKQVSEHKKGLQCVSENLLLINSPPGLPEKLGFSWVNRRNHIAISNHLKPHLEKPGVKIILWVAHPKGVEIADHLDHALCIYDCYDAFGEFQEEKWKADDIKKLESKLLKRADLVLASAQSLADTCKNHNSNVHLVPNGADVSHFQKVMEKPELNNRGFEPSALQNDISKVQRPIVGYMGDMASWLDVDTLFKSASEMTDVSFVFLGTVKRDVEKLKALPNVHFFGRIDYADLPYFIRHFDVCTIPFIVNEMTVHVNPIKVYEYMATGLPIVSSKLPEVVSLGDLIYFYDDVIGADDFQRVVRDALAEGKSNSDLPDHRRETASANSWDARVDKIWDLIVELL